ENGDYTVFVTDKNGCSDTSDVYEVNNANSVKDISGIGESIRIYPNPATAYVTIMAPVDVHVSIYSVDGKLIKGVQNAHKVAFGDFAEGVYFFYLYNQDNRLLKVQKIVKTR